MTSDTNDNTNSRRRSIKLKFRDLFEIEIRGHDVLMVLVAVAIAWLVFASLEQREGRTAAVSNISVEHKAIVEGMKRQEEATIDLIYIMTLTPEQRIALKLDMPQSLRQKLRDSR